MSEHLQDLINLQKAFPDLYPSFRRASRATRREDLIRVHGPIWPDNVVAVLPTVSQLRRAEVTGKLWKTC